MKKVAIILLIFLLVAAGITAILIVSYKSTKSNEEELSIEDSISSQVIEIESTEEALTSTETEYENITKYVVNATGFSNYSDGEIFKYVNTICHDLNYTGNVVAEFYTSDAENWSIEYEASPNASDYSDTHPPVGYVLVFSEDHVFYLGSIYIFSDNLIVDTNPKFGDKEDH